MILFLFATFLAVVASQPNEQSVCSRWGTLYESMCHDQVERSAIVVRQGLPGKRGPVGDKGERGLNGSKGEKGGIGEVDYDRVEEMILLRVDEVARSQSRRFSELMNTLTEASEETNRLTSQIDNDVRNQSQKISELLNTLIGVTKETGRLAGLITENNLCPIRYNGKCFWVAARFEPKITYAQGREICADLGGAPANIYSEEHHNMMMEYLRTFAVKDGWMEAWVGVTVELVSLAYASVLLSDGSNAPFRKWYPGRPDILHCCNIALRAEMDWGSDRQHMVTFDPLWNIRGVICEK